MVKFEDIIIGVCIGFIIGLFLGFICLEPLKKMQYEQQEKAIYSYKWALEECLSQIQIQEGNFNNYIINISEVIK